MENNTTKSRGALKAMFLIPSIIGVIIFMIPMKIGGSWTVVVKVISDALKNAIGYDNVAMLCIGILTVSEAQVHYGQ